MTSGLYIPPTSVSPVQANTGSNELLVTLTSPTPMQVTVHIQGTAEAPAGTPFPTLLVDVADDGVFELTESSMFPSSIAMFLSPTPRFIRLRTGCTLSQPGLVNANVTVTLTPGFSSVTQLVEGCSPTLYTVQPKFDGNVRVTAQPLPGSVVVAVFGMVPVGALLGSTASLPCFLIPQDDILLPIFTSTVFEMPVAPYPGIGTFYTQAVTLQGSQLLTTDGYAVGIY